MTPEAIIGEFLRNASSPPYTVYQARLPTGYRNESPAIVYYVGSQSYPYIQTGRLGQYVVYLNIYGGSDDWQETDELRESLRMVVHGSSSGTVRQCVVVTASGTRLDPVTGWPVSSMTLQFRLQTEDE